MPPATGKCVGDPQAGGAFDGVVATESRGGLAMNGWDWNVIYLTCFAVGLVLSFVSFFGGALHLHIGRFQMHGLTKGAHGHSRHAASPLNGFTLMAFLCWFGGTGYLLHETRVFNVALVLLFSAISGIAGASLVFW